MLTITGVSPRHLIRTILHAAAELVVDADAEAAATLTAAESDYENEWLHGCQGGLGGIWEPWRHNRPEG